MLTNVFAAVKQTLFRFITAAFLSVFVLLLNLPTDLGRAALLDVLRATLRTAVPGTLSVGRIDTLNLSEVRLSGLSWRDLRSAPFAEGGTLSIKPFHALLGVFVKHRPAPPIELRLQRAWLDAPVLPVEPPTTTPTSPSQPSSTIWKIPRVDIHITEVLSRAAPTVALHRVHLDGGLEIRPDGVTVHVRTFDLDAQYRHLDPIALHLDGNLSAPDPLRVGATLALHNRHLGCTLRIDTARDNSYLAQISHCTLGEGLIDRVLERSASPHLPVVSIDLSATVQQNLTWSARANLNANQQTLRLEGHGTADQQSVIARVEDFSLARAVPELIDAHLDGHIELRHRADQQRHHIIIDTRGLTGTVSNVPLAPIVASLTLDGQRVELLSLRSDTLGLRASGTVDLAHRSPVVSLHADLRSPELSTLPWTHGLASGRLNARVTASGPLDILRANLRLDATRLRVAGVTAGTLSLNGDVTRRPNRTSINARLNGNQVSLPNVVSADSLTASIQGNLEDQLAVNLSAQGDGLLQSLGPLPVAQRHATGPTTANLSASVNLRNPTEISVQLRPSSLSLRGTEATVSGRVTVDRTGRRPPRVALALSTPRSGEITVSHSGDTVQLNAQRFDLAWLHDVVPGLSQLSGVIAGTVRYVPAAPNRSHADLQIERLGVPHFGDVGGHLTLTPEAHSARLRAVLAPLRNDNPARMTLDALVTVPRNQSDSTRWLQGTHSVDLTLHNLDLERLDNLAPAPFLARGVVDLDLHGRPDPTGALALTIGLEARSLVAGIDLTAGLGPVRRLAPAVVPLRMRVAGCTTLHSLDLDTAPLSLRLALAHDFNETPDGPPESCTAAGINRPTLTTLSLDTAGPWSSAFTALSRELTANPSSLSPATQDLARRTTVDLHATVGPLLRLQWPLRLIALPQRNGPPLVLRPPDVPNDTMAQVDLRLHGPLLTANGQLQLSVQGSRVDPIGLTEPYRVEATLGLSPPTNSTLLDTINLDLATLAQVSPTLSRELQGRVEVDVRTSISPSQLRHNGLDAITWRRFDVSTENLALERFAWAQSKGLYGLVNAHVRATGDPHSPVDATVTVRDVRTRFTDDLALAGHAPPRESVRMQARLDARATRHGDTLGLDACLRATLRNSTEPCDPLHPSSPGDESLQLTGHVPVGASLATLGVRLRDATANLSASRFRLDAISGFVPDDLLTNLGGQLDATLAWRGELPNHLQGTVKITNGSATLTTLGEPMRNLDLDLVAQGARLELRALDARMGRGTIHLQGNALLASNPWLIVSLQGRTDTFPVALSGYTWAWIDGAFRLGMVFRNDQARGNLEVETLRALVQEQPSVDLQALSPNPRVFIVGRTQARASAPPRAYPINLSIRSASPIWLRRSDFTLAVRTNLRVRSDRAGLSLSEHIELASTQSWFSIFGKRFDLDRVRVTFDGNVGMNPELDISAHYDSPTAGRLGVAVSGRLAHPTVTFNSTNYPTASQAEILAMIAIGRRDTPSASASGDLFGQAGQAVLSLVSGLLATSLSREFSFLPTIIAEPGAGGGRYGAGVNLGPRVYLQATLSAAGTSAGATTTNSPEFRVLLEYALNEAITLSGSWSTLLNGRWGADVLWSP